MQIWKFLLCAEETPASTLTRAQMSYGASAGFEHLIEYNLGRLLFEGLLEYE